MRRWGIAVLLFVAAGAAFAQSTTAVLVGRVTSNAAPLPGVMVTITSPALQGARSVETSIHGTYSFAAVPPGAYRVTFAMSGLQTVARSAELHLAETTRVDAELHAVLAEEIDVTPAPQAGLETLQVTTNLDQEFVNILPIGRGITDIAKLAAGVHDSGPRRFIIINGAHAFENLWLVNGAVITEGMRNQPQNLFIEDAIQETTVLTAGVSAEYGRFTGGVISVITKQGGNEWTGSLRDTLTSDRWTSRLPLDPEALDKINHDYEGTVGGRILRDRLWFFGAGRYAERRRNLQTRVTEIPYAAGSDERRWEGKLTANLGASQSVVASYLDVDALELNTSLGPVGDLRTPFDTEAPHSLMAAQYMAVLASAATIEAQFTRKEYTVFAGGTDRSFVGGTQINDFVNGFTAWAPSFCAPCGNSYRDNREALLKTTWFVSRPRWGTHTIVAGVNDFHELAANSQHQSASDFVISSPMVLVDGQLYLTMVPEESSLEWFPIFVPSLGDDFGTRSAYINDRIDWGRHFTFNAGIRYDHSRGKDQGGSDQAEDSRWSPRLGAIWDIGGDGRNRVSASFGRYAAKVDAFVARAAAPAGDPGIFSWLWDGEEINTGDGPLIPTEEVIARVQEWFLAMGGTSATHLAQFGDTAGGTIVEDKLKAPVMDEVTLGYGRQFGSSAFLRADLVRRRWSDFYTNRVTPETGKTTDSAGNVSDTIVIENSDEGLRREYDGISLQGQWKRGDVVVGGNYTLSRLQGNVEQETVNAGTTAIHSPVAYFPEYTGFANYAPMGYLSGDERHRGNLWAAYTVSGGFGRFTGSLLQTYHSGRRYHARAGIEVRPYVTNPGYRQPAIPEYFFTPRGSLQLDDISATNIALNYAKVIGRVEAFLETDLLNVFNEQGVETSVLTTVRTSRNDRNLVPFNPFTTAPVECPRDVPSSSAQCRGIANYQLTPTFGNPSSRDSYQAPRTVRVSFGLRF